MQIPDTYLPSWDELWIFYIFKSTFLKNSFCVKFQKELHLFIQKCKCILLKLHFIHSIHSTWRVLTVVPWGNLKIHTTEKFKISPCAPFSMWIIMVWSSLGMNCPMFANCSGFGDVREVRSSVLGQIEMFRSVRSSILKFGKHFWTFWALFWFLMWEKGKKKEKTFNFF